MSFPGGPPPPPEEDDKLQRFLRNLVLQGTFALTGVLTAYHLVTNVSDNEHRRRLKRNLRIPRGQRDPDRQIDPREQSLCVGKDDPEGNGREQAHHIIPLRYFAQGMGDIHAILEEAKSQLPQLKTELSF